MKAERPDWPVISLDALREQLGVRPEDDQAPVANRAREQAREFLRRGQRFAWNATNLSRDLRARSIDLFSAYGARITTVYVEAGPERLFVQNRQRQGQAVVPERVVERLLRRWEIPDLTESHGLLLAVQ